MVTMPRSLVSEQRTPASRESHQNKIVMAIMNRLRDFCVFLYCYQAFLNLFPSFASGLLIERDIMDKLYIRCKARQALHILQMVPTPYFRLFHSWLQCDYCPLIPKRMQNVPLFFIVRNSRSQLNGYRISSWLGVILRPAINLKTWEIIWQWQSTIEQTC